MAATVQLIGTAECLRTDGGTVLATSDGVYDTEHDAVRDSSASCSRRASSRSTPRETGSPRHRPAPTRRAVWLGAEHVSGIGLLSGHDASRHRLWSVFEEYAECSVTRTTSHVDKIIYS